MGYIDDRLCSGRASISDNVALTVQEEMEIVASSSTHGEVSTREVACRTGISCTTVWVALRHALLCNAYKIQDHHKLARPLYETENIFGVGISKDDDWLCNVCGLTKPISHMEGLSYFTIVEFGLLKIPELLC